MSSITRKKAINSQTRPIIRRRLYQNEHNINNNFKLLINQFEPIFKPRNNQQMQTKTNKQAKNAKETRKNEKTLN